MKPGMGITLTSCLLIICH